MKQKEEKVLKIIGKPDLIAIFAHLTMRLKPIITAKRFYCEN